MTAPLSDDRLAELIEARSGRLQGHDSRPPRVAVPARQGGRLRDHLSFHQRDEEVIDLIVDLCLRYCEPRATQRKGRE
jgi:hypothetical protein